VEKLCRRYPDGTSLEALSYILKRAGDINMLDSVQPGRRTAVVGVAILFLFLGLQMGCGEWLTRIPTEPRFFTNSIGMKFTLIPPGRFDMGSPPNETDRNSDETSYRFDIKESFYLGVYEVTQAQWKLIMGNNPSRFKGDARPVEQVSWNEIQIFIQKLNAREQTNKYRLPAEAEWEYACRAGTVGPFAYGDCLSTDEANYNGNYPYPGCPKGDYRGETISVGSLKPNGFGLYDMHGNVGEWCQDRYVKNFGLKRSVRSSGHLARGKHRVYRGGNWYLPAYLCRSANRDIYRPDYGCDAIGFRLLKMP
jgi:formylglycine-generating enzyme required for sulfatase activity